MVAIDFGRVAYGLWRFNENDFEAGCAAVEAAREVGITHFDTADVYGHECGMGSTERLVGRIRKEAPSLFEGATVATKGGIIFGTPYDSSEAYLREAVEASLRNLQTEQIDLYYIHRPDELTHLRDLAATLDALVAEGKIANVAVSNFRPQQIYGLVRYLKAPLVGHQIEFSALHHEPISNGLLDQAMELDFAVPVWSPLAGGTLFESESRPVLRVREALEAIAIRDGLTVSDVALSFVRSHPSKTVPIVGTRTPARVREAAAAVERTLSRKDWYAIYEAARGERMP